MSAIMKSRGITIMTLKSLLKKHGKKLALVIGNGIHRYGPSSATNSWHDLLVKLSKKHLPSSLRRIPPGIALTEFYDLLELRSRQTTRSLQRTFCDLMDGWHPYDHHRRIVSWAQMHKAPILTTNFDRVLSDAGDYPLKHTKLTRQKGFTDFYPWETYYGIDQVNDPSNTFGIWHVNGMAHYSRSVRLGLTHYMGSVQRARSWIHGGNETRLFSGKNIRNWVGAGSWLHIVFNNPLVIFGLRLDENEVFLRWLLIERARYFKKFPNRKKRGWYVHTESLEDSGKKLLLEGVGVELVKVDDYEELYGSSTWK
jgi:hypothetical protein